MRAYQTYNLLKRKTRKASKALSEELQKMLKMKTIKLIAVALALIAAASVAACAKKDEIDANISELRSDIYEVSDMGTRISVYSGEREKPFALDGVAGKRSGFTQINFKPPIVISALKHTYLLTDGDSKFSGEFTMHPFGTGYVAELDHKMVSDLLTLEIKQGETASTYILPSVKGEGFMDWNTALDIAKTALAQEITALTDGKTLNAEIIIRLLCDPSNNSAEHYWYVAYATSAKTYAVLIDPKTREILASKK